MLWIPTAEDAAARGNLHTDDAHLLFHGQGQQLLLEAEVVRVGGVDGHQYLIKGEAANALQQHAGIGVSGDAEEAHHLLLAGFDEGFDGSALGEDAVHVVLRGDVVELPGVEVIGVEQLQALFEQAQRTVAGAVVRLAGQVGFAAAALHHLADVALAPTVGAAVLRGGVNVVDAEIEGALDDGHGDGGVVGLLDGGLPAEREDSGTVAGFAQVAGGHGGGRKRIVRQGVGLMRSADRGGHHSCGGHG